MRLETIAYSAALYVFLQALYNNRAEVKEAKENKEFEAQEQRLKESVEKIVEARKQQKTEDERILQDVLPEDDIEEIDFVDDSDEREIMADFQDLLANERQLEEQIKQQTIEANMRIERREEEERRRRKSRNFFFNPWDD